MGWLAGWLAGLLAGCGGRSAGRLAARWAGVKSRKRATLARDVVGHTVVMAVLMSVLSRGWVGTHRVFSKGGAGGVWASGGRALAGWLAGWPAGWWAASGCWLAGWLALPIGVLAGW